MRGKALRGSALAFGEYGLKALDCSWLSSKQLEAGRRAITHSLKKGGRMWIRVFPDKPVSGRAAGQRMGGGKGDVDRYVCVINPGKVIYEIAGVTEEIAKAAFAKAAAKMPFKTKIVSRD